MTILAHDRLTSVCLAFLLPGLCTSLSVHGQQRDPSSDGVPGEAPTIVVAATVDGMPIYRAQIQQQVERVLGAREATAEARQRLQAEALEQLVKQQIVLASLDARGLACAPEQVDLAVSRLTDELARQQKTLDDYCRSLGLDEDALRRTIRWQLTWKAYLEKHLTDENLRRYFDEHRTDFDGTRLRVAQILWKPTDDADERRTILQRASALRQEILEGELSFAAAAHAHSQSPSAAQGGALGWISRREPMPEIFSQTAFELKMGEISQPLVSPLGVHLIQCLEVSPGTKTWQDAREALREAVIRYLFDWNANRPEKDPVIRYTGTVPYFKAGTHEIVAQTQDETPPDERTGK